MSKNNLHFCFWLFLILFHSLSTRPSISTFADKLRRNCFWLPESLNSLKNIHHEKKTEANIKTSSFVIPIPLLVLVLWFFSMSQTLFWRWIEKENSKVLFFHVHDFYADNRIGRRESATFLGVLSVCVW